MRENLDSIDKKVSLFVSDLRINEEINSLSERGAMGLPDSLVDFYTEARIAITHSLRYLSFDVLQKIASNTASHFMERICASELSICKNPEAGDEYPVFVSIPKGISRVGTPDAEVRQIYEKYKYLGVKENWIEKECPQHSVNIEGFSAAKFPVTNLQYRAFLRDTSFNELPTSWHYGQFPFERANHPVYTLSETACQTYCAWLSRKLMLNIRLPTEAEWEYLANSGKGQQYTWGDTFQPKVCNTNELLYLSTTPVNIFHESSSGFGVYDLIGNVEEFVSEQYHPYPGGKLIEDDLYKKLGHYRIAKGGAFNRFSDLARIQRRHGAYPSSLYAIGFRVVYSS